MRWGCSSWVVKSSVSALDLGLSPGSAFAISSWTLGKFVNISEPQSFHL